MKSGLSDCVQGESSDGIQIISFDCINGESLDKGVGVLTEEGDGGVSGELPDGLICLAASKIDCTEVAVV
jgi:hypothetical protein